MADYQSSHSGPTIDTRVSQVATNTADIAALKSRMNSAEAEIDTKADTASVTALSSQVGGVLAKIPSEATTSNKLADKAYVDSSVSGKASQSDLTNLTNRVTAVEANKVDKVSGKGLSTNDYTTAEKNKVASIGNLNELETEDKSSIVAAINEAATTGAVTVELLERNIRLIYDSLGAAAFWDVKPDIDWSGNSVPISLSLSNCSSSNLAGYVALGDPYYTEITPASGSILASVSCTMGGEDVLVVNGVIDIAEVTGAIIITAVGANLDTIAYENKTYKQIFETNNDFGISPGFENGSYSPMTVSSGSASIETTEVESGTYALNVSSTGSNVPTQMKSSTVKSGKFYLALRCKVTAYTIGSAGFYVTDNIEVIRRTTDGWETISKKTTSLSSKSLFFGTGGETSTITAYVDTPVAVPMSIFSAEPTKDEMDVLYTNYVGIKKNA